MSNSPSNILFSKGFNGYDLCGFNEDSIFWGGVYTEHNRLNQRYKGALVVAGGLVFLVGFMWQRI
jgi:hypothetical protein